MRCQEDEEEKENEKRRNRIRHMRKIEKLTAEESRAGKRADVAERRKRGELSERIEEEKR